MTALAARIEVIALSGVPRARPGDVLVELVRAGLHDSGEALHAHDVVVVTSKLLSRCEGRFVDLSQVELSPEAARLAEEVGKEPALVEVILGDTAEISRKATGVLITRHELGHVSANAGIDRSNARPPDATEGSGPWVLRLPTDPDGSAASLRAALEAAGVGPIGVVITDTCGRPQRLGTVGLALGVAGLPVIADHRGRTDLDGRVLQASTSALADQVAATADMLAGQADEGTPVVIVRGLRWEPDADASATQLHRPPEQDLYR